MHLKMSAYVIITKTYLYNFDSLKPHFYIVKLGFTGVYIIFVISAQKHRLWVLVRTASTSTHNLCFEQKYEKYQNFLSEKLPFLVVKFSIYLNRRVFVMLNKKATQTESLPVKIELSKQTSLKRLIKIDHKRKLFEFKFKKKKKQLSWRPPFLGYATSHSPD